MRNIIPLLSLAGTVLAFPAIGRQPEGMNTTHYRNDSRPHPHPHHQITTTTVTLGYPPAPSYTRLPQPAEEKAGESEERVDVEVNIKTPLVTQLIPSVHWSIDTSDTTHIIPAPYSSVYYSEDGTNGM